MGTEQRQQWLGVCWGCGKSVVLLEQVPFVCDSCYGEIVPLVYLDALTSLRRLRGDAPEGGDDELILQAIIEDWWALRSGREQGGA